MKLIDKSQLDSRGSVQRLVVLALALITLMSAALILSTPSDAVDGTTSGDCGTNLTWELVENEDVLYSHTYTNSAGYENTAYTSEPWSEYSEGLGATPVAGGTDIKVQAYTLKISGTGTTMSDFDIMDYLNKTVWFGSSQFITQLELPDGLQYIGKYAFVGFSIGSVDIPASVTGVGTAAFLECSNLSSVNFDDLTSLSSLGGSAFEGCALVEVDLSNTRLTSISAAAFQYNDSMTSVTLPVAVTSLGQQAFTSNENLTTIVIPEGSKLATIGDSAFWSTGFTTLDLSNATELSRIGGSAMQSCLNLETVILPEADSLTIEGFQFVGDENLKTVDTSRVESLVINERRTFADSGITNIDLSMATFTTVEENMFEGCDSLESVKLPSTLTGIGERAFYNLPALKDVTLSNPSALTSIGASAFVGTAITSMDLSQTQITSVGNNTFWLCRSLESVELPSTVTSIGYGAFSATGLESLNFEDLTGLTTIGASAFEASSLTDVDLSETKVETIMDGAFHNNDNLRSVTIPTTVTEIRPQSFNQCANLETLVIPQESELATIGESAFSATGMESVDLSNATKLTSLGDSAFGDNPSLSDVKLPETMTTVPSAAFTDSPVENMAVGDSFTVIFDPNGGEGDRKFQIMDADGSLQTNTFERGGCTFDGWSTAADGSGTSYGDGASFTIPENETSIVLYAQWSDPIITIGGQGYDTLAEAFAAAEDGETITLHTDIENCPRIELADGGTYILDMNGHSIEFEADSYFALINADLNITGSGTVEEGSPNLGPFVIRTPSTAVAGQEYVSLSIGADITARGWAPVFISYTDSSNANAYGVSVDVHGTLDSVRDGAGSVGAGIYVNGTIQKTDDYPVIRIHEDAEITSLGNGAYIAGFAELDISGGTIIGQQTGIEIRAGILEITGDPVIEGNGTFTCNPNSNGSTTTGVAVAVVQHTTEKSIDIDISGGTFRGTYGLYEANPQGNPGPSVDDIVIDIGGGNFEGTEAAVVINDFRDMTANGTGISGGTFSSNVSKYAAPGYAIVPTADGTFGPVPADTPEITIDFDNQVVEYVAKGTTVVIPASDGVFGNVTLDISFETADVTVIGTVKDDVTMRYVAFESSSDVSFDLHIAGVSTSDMSVTITVPMTVESGYTIVEDSLYVYSVVGDVIRQEQAYLSGDSIVIVTNHNTPFHINYDVEYVIPPFFDDDGEYIPPIVPVQPEDSGDDDNTEIVACAAAAVVAALMAAFLIIERRRN